MIRRIKLLKSCCVLSDNLIYNGNNSARFCSNKTGSSSSPDEPPGPENPFSRTFRVLGNDVKYMKNNVLSFFSRARNIMDAADKFNKEHNRPISRYHQEMFPEHCDIVVIGGGAIGSSVAYWLKQRAPKGISVTVIEKDPSVNDNIIPWYQYAEASTALSVGGIRQQFSLEENIKMSLFGADFLRNVKRFLTVEGHDPPDVCFTPSGYLFLASESGAETLEENSKLQRQLGAKNVLLTSKKLKEKFPWLDTTDIALGCYGLENEGWFDPWCFLSALKKKAISLGVEYVNGEVTGFQFRKMPDLMMEGIEQGSYETIDKVVVKLNTGEVRAIKFAIAVLAAGANSGKVARLARIGSGPGLLSIPLPIEPRKRYVYCFNCKNGPGLNTPLTVDPSGVYFRREGLTENYIAGRSPLFEDEPSVDNLDVDHSFFDSDVWPHLAARVPAFECLKVNNAWAGFYEYNTYDENGIIGAHPYYTNLIIASGFSGHGIQHAAAVGRSVMELILDCSYQTIDLTRFSFDRLLTDMPLREQNIV